MRWSKDLWIIWLGRMSSKRNWTSLSIASIALPKNSKTCALTPKQKKSCSPDSKSSQTTVLPLSSSLRMRILPNGPTSCSLVGLSTSWSSWPSAESICLQQRLIGSWLLRICCMIFIGHRGISRCFTTEIQFLCPIRWACWTIRRYLILKIISQKLRTNQDFPWFWPFSKKPSSLFCT